MRPELIVVSTPLTPTAPTQKPSTIIGTPPPSTVKPLDVSAPRGPFAAASSASVGFLNRAAVFAFCVANSAEAAIAPERRLAELTPPLPLRVDPNRAHHAELADLSHKERRRLQSYGSAGSTNMVPVQRRELLLDSNTLTSHTHTHTLNNTHTTTHTDAPHAPYALNLLHHVLPPYSA